MTAPRLDTPDLGAPLSAGTDFRGVSGTDRGTDADLDPTSQAAPAGAATSETGSGSIEGVLNAISGAAVTAPQAAFEQISAKAKELLINSGSSTTQTSDIGDKLAAAAPSNAPSLEQVQAQASAIAAQAGQTAQNLASQAGQYAQQALGSLPPQVQSYIPTSVTSALGSSGSTATHHADAPITAGTRETTSAPIVESRSDRPQGIAQPLIPDTSSASAGVSTSAINDITKPHTTGTFEAAGSLQATKNPEIIEAQSDLAARAEAGDV